MKLGIFTSFDKYTKNYIRSCEELGVDFELIDIIAPNWLTSINKSNCDGFLCRPPSKFFERKSMFDERLYILNKILKKPIYPSYDELFIYENKRLMSYWLDLYNFPKADTYVFYRKRDFKKFIEEYEDFPIVIKSNTGSTSKGVRIVKTKRAANKIANRAFGLFEPKLARGYTSITTGKIISLPSWGSREKHFVLAQKFEKIKWEWRVIKIDESYFSHKKLLVGDFASGSLKKEYGKAPDELFFLVKDICDKGNFCSMDVDIFETEDGRFLINELQSLFGQYSEDILYIDGVPGRMVFKDNKFVFEEGHFNQHKSYKLRVEHFIKILESKQKEENEN